VNTDTPVVSGPLQDPSALATQQLLREINGLEKLLDARLTALEKTQAHFEDGITRVPTEVQKATRALRELLQETFSVHLEKFAGINQQLASRDGALAAALVAQKELVAEQNKASEMAITKSETAVNRQLEQLQMLISTSTGGLNDKIDDLKGRVTAVEARGVGESGTRSESRQSNHLLLATVLGAVSVIALGVTIVSSIAN
jgi:hypothetical protein